MTQSLKNGLRAALTQIDRPIGLFLQSCVHCGLCAEACLFFTETRDPRYTPIYKLEPLKRLWRQEFTFPGKLMRLLRLSRPVSDAELAEWESLVYDSCTLCGRCSLVCPVGNDITYMIRKFREVMVAAGHAPADLEKASVQAMAHVSPIGVGLTALKKQVADQAAATGLPIPLDQEGAEYMVLLSSMEIIGFPEIIGALARLFHKAGHSWTISTQAYEATNIGIQIGSKDVARALVQRIVVAAEALKVKTVVSPECGHAWQALRWEGPNLIGRAYPFQVVQVIDLLESWRASGKIRLKPKVSEAVTYHDPCQLSRRAGLDGPARRLLGEAVGEFREMAGHDGWGWCCGGGGGVSANHRATDLRFKAFGVRKREIEAVGARTVVTACANCRNVMEEAIDHYGMDVTMAGLAELVAGALADEPGQGERKA